MDFMETSPEQEMTEVTTENGQLAGHSADMLQYDPIASLQPASTIVDNGIASAYVDIVTILRILLINSWLIILITGIGTVGAFLYTETQTPIYETSTTLIVLPFGDPSRDEIDAIRALNLNIIGTYVQILTSRSVRDNAHAALEDTYTRGAIREAQTEVRPINNSSIIRVSARSSNPELAKDLVDEIASQAINNSPVDELVEAYPAQILDTSELPTDPVSPQRRLALVFGAAGSAAVGVVLAFLLDGFTQYRRAAKQRRQEEEALPGA